MFYIWEQEEGGRKLGRNGRKQFVRVREKSLLNKNIHGVKKPMLFESGFIESGSGSSILGWIPIRIRVLMTKNWKNLQLKKNSTFFGSKIAVYLPLGLQKKKSNLQKFSALKIKLSALQNMNFHNFFYFCGSFLHSWIRIWIRIHWSCWMQIRIRVRNTTGTHLFPCASQCCQWRAPWAQTRPQTKATSGC